MITNKTVQPRRARITHTFSGESTAASPFTIATITGRIRITDFTAFCTSAVTVTNAPSLAVGVATDTDAFIAATVCSTIAVNTWWGTSSPAVDSYNPTSTHTGGYQTSQGDKWLSNNIIGTVTGAGGVITGGTVVFDIWYYPVTDNGYIA